MRPVPEPREAMSPPVRKEKDDAMARPRASRPGKHTPQMVEGARPSEFVPYSRTQKATPAWQQGANLRESPRRTAKTATDRTTTAG